MKNKKLLIGIALIIITTGLMGCDSSVTSTPTPKATPTATQNPTPSPNPAEDDPNMPLFLKNLDPQKNSDGTYSFKGRITSYQFSPYSNDPTIYITSTNGREFSTGDTSLYYSLYINNAGEYGTIINDLLTSPQLLKGILFEFVYDSNGNFVELRQ